MSLNGNVGPTAPENKAYTVPPDTVRHIVDKTAPYVARYGELFEKPLMQIYACDSKFSFLNASDPYHAYYQHRMAEAYLPDQQPIQPEVSACAPPTAY